MLGAVAEGLCEGEADSLGVGELDSLGSSLGVGVTLGFGAAVVRVWVGFAGRLDGSAALGVTDFVIDFSGAEVGSALSFGAGTERLGIDPIDGRTVGTGGRLLGSAPTDGFAELLDSSPEGSADSPTAGSPEVD